jgi:hypothetical protein
MWNSVLMRVNSIYPTRVMLPIFSRTTCSSRAAPRMPSFAKMFSMSLHQELWGSFYLGKTLKSALQSSRLKTEILGSMACRYLDRYNLKPALYIPKTQATG